MASLLKEGPMVISRRISPVTAAWRSPLPSMPLETAVTLPFILSLQSARSRGSWILVGAAATSLVVHGLGLIWILSSAPLPAPAARPIPVELVAIAEDGVRATAAIGPSTHPFTAPPSRGAVRRPATTMSMPAPAASRKVTDEPAPEIDGGGAPGAAALVTTSPVARETGVARRVFGEGEVDLPARPLIRVRPRYPEHARLLARESDVKLAVTVEADGAVSSVELVESGGEEFDREAREAVERVRFEPARRAGAPVPARVTFMVRFRLDD
ncbi:MAG TPA: energy transducer TonB [Myxococcota bacterium]|nr:energy transducer TonB [Myxococcota bacterium]